VRMSDAKRDGKPEPPVTPKEEGKGEAKGEAKDGAGEDQLPEPDAKVSPRGPKVASKGA
jgi:hypothetical protein